MSCGYATLGPCRQGLITELGQRTSRWENGDTCKNCSKKLQSGHGRPAVFADWNVQKALCV